MKKVELLAISLTLAFLLAADPCIAAGPTADGKAAVFAAESSVKAPLVKAAQTAPAKAPAAKPLDINSASAAQLEKILGIGEATAKKIIAGRPYFKKDQLKSRKILTAAQYYKIKDYIIAKRPKSPVKTGKSR